MDAAGTVESVGAGVERFAIGDEVMAAVTPRRPEGGAQAELVVAPAASVVPVPHGATLEQAATLPMNGLTALRGLELLDLDPGATLGVTGGAGLLASYVIPIAKLRGLRVLADAGLADAELVRGFGADVVLPRGDDLPEAMRAAAPGGVDAVFDTAVLGRSIFPAIRTGGSLAYVRTWDGDDVENGIEIHRVLVREVLERTDWLRELSDLAARGVLVLRVAATFPPERSPDAHRQMEAGGLRGRAVIVFD
jgi:NADPH:quinone reductase-like Zn-dependent oxidoreductase